MPRGLSRRRGQAARWLLALVLALATWGLAACTAGSRDDGASAGSDDEVSTGDRQAEAPGATDGADTAAAVTLQARAVIATGRLELVGKDLERVRAAVQDLMSRYGGYVADQSTHNDDEGRTTRSTMTLRVPSRHFQAVIAAFDELGTVTKVVTEAEDVTTEVIDVAARVRTQELSLRRLRTFLGRTNDVAGMIRLESEIAEREASVESLRAQQKYLADQTSLATLTVAMRTPGTAAEEDEPLTAGFGAGLSAGWRALQAGFAVAATVLGAALPVVAPALVVGVPLWVRRRRRPPRPVPEGPVPEG